MQAHAAFKRVRNDMLTDKMCGPLFCLVSFTSHSRNLWRQKHQIRHNVSVLMTFWRQHLFPRILTSMGPVGNVATLAFISFNIWLLTVMGFHEEKKNKYKHHIVDVCVSFPYYADFLLLVSEQLSLSSSIETSKFHQGRNNCVFYLIPVMSNCTTLSNHVL